MFSAGREACSKEECKHRVFWRDNMNHDRIEQRRTSTGRNGEPSPFELVSGGVPVLRTTEKYQEAMQKFSFTFLAQLLPSVNSQTNLFASPISVVTALSMVANGARGATLEGIQTALQAKGLTLQELNLATHLYKDRLESLDPKVTLQIANALYASDTVSLAPDFERTVRLAYDAEVQTADFRGNCEAAVKSINKWVEVKTERMIHQIIDRLDPETIAVLLNAIYFKGKWSHKFDSQRTNSDGRFTNADGKEVTIPMMNQRGKFAYHHFQGEECQAIRMPYGQGDFGMVILLPDEGSSLTRLQGKLTANTWANMYQTLRSSGPQHGEITMPRFRTEYEVTLNQVLSDMGMADAFEVKADFSRMIEVDERFAISKVLHKAVVDVDESGTEAAAVTAVVLERFCEMVPMNPFDMRVDHPFFFAIEHEGVPLFYGAIKDPTK
jgi:serine protease inhibitor